MERRMWKEHIIVLLLGILMVFGTLYRTGTLQSGYHLLDDHELIRIHQIFAKENVSLGSMIKSTILNDFTWRYRPLYWVERITGIKIFGTEMLYWNYYTAIKGILTFYFLYFIARYLKYNRTISLLFAGIIIFGAQFTPWYRSANQESTGLLLCAFTLYFIAKQYYTKKYDSLLYNIPIVAGAVLCGLVKESFTLFMPTFVALKFWLEYCEKEEVIKCLKKNIIVYAVVLISMLVNICIIVFYVGTDHVSYAGFQEGISLAEYWSGIMYSLKFNLRSYTIVGEIILFAVAMFGEDISKNLRKKYLGFAIIGFYVIVVELIAHAKSLMWERYIIPWIVGYAIVFVLLGYRIFEQSKKRRILYAGLLLTLFVVEAPKAYNMSRDYTYIGQMVRLYFQDILDNTEEYSQIVCAFYDGELSLATECWLEVHGRTQVYSYDTVNGEFSNNVQLEGIAPEEYSWESAKVVTCYGDQVEQVLQWMDLSDESQYNVSINSNYCVISRLE